MAEAASRRCLCLIASLISLLRRAALAAVRDSLRAGIRLAPVEGIALRGHSRHRPFGLWLGGDKLGLRRSSHNRRSIVWTGSKHGARATRFALDLSDEDVARLKRGRTVRMYGGGDTLVLRMKNGTIVVGRALHGMAGSYRLSRRGGLKDEEPE
ncbi:hypothetical protein MOTC310_18070 [Methylobacterium oryzae]|uniref:Uncharacterized protein n=1 Tax=Methylobacterium oryzae TaxID=334852 RepID=A0ABU7TRI4_9HYPH